MTISLCDLPASGYKRPRVTAEEFAEESANLHDTLNSVATIAEAQLLHGTLDPLYKHEDYVVTDMQEGVDRSGALALHRWIPRNWALNNDWEPVIIAAESSSQIAEYPLGRNRSPIIRATAHGCAGELIYDFDTTVARWRNQHGDPMLWEDAEWADLQSLVREFRIDRQELTRLCQRLWRERINALAYVGRLDLDTGGKRNDEMVTIAQIARHAGIEPNSMTRYTKDWGEPESLRGRGRKQKLFLWERIRPIVIKQFSGMDWPDVWQPNPTPL